MSFDIILLTYSFELITPLLRISIVGRYLLAVVKFSMLTMTSASKIDKIVQWQILAQSRMHVCLVYILDHSTMQIPTASSLAFSPLFLSPYKERISNRKYFWWCFQHFYDKLNDNLSKFSKVTRMTVFQTSNYLEYSYGPTYTYTVHKPTFFSYTTTDCSLDWKS